MLFTTKLLSLAVCSTFAMGVSFAGAVQIAGYEWDGAYDASALPDASTPAWVKSGDPTAAGTVSGGILTVNTTNALYGPEDGNVPGNLGYSLLPSGAAGAWNPSTSASSYVQFGLKVNSQSSVPFAGLFRVADGVDHNITLYFGTYSGNTGIFDNAYSLIQAVDLSVPHDIRVAIDPVADTYTLQVDEFSTAGTPISSYYNTASPNLIIAGNGDAVGSFDIDYVAWNNASEPVAVPEPASVMALLAVGVASLARRRSVR